MSTTLQSQPTNVILNAEGTSNTMGSLNFSDTSVTHMDMGHTFGAMTQGGALDSITNTAGFAGEAMAEFGVFGIFMNFIERVYNEIDPNDPTLQNTNQLAQGVALTNAIGAPSMNPPGL